MLEKCILCFSLKLKVLSFERPDNRLISLINVFFAVYLIKNYLGSSPLRKGETIFKVPMYVPVAKCKVILRPSIRDQNKK